MSALGDALLAELSANQLQALAERLRPYLTPAESKEDGWLDGIEAIATYLGCPTSRLYDPRYRAESGIPLCKVGRAWAAKKSELDAWRKGS